MEKSSPFKVSIGKKLFNKLHIAVLLINNPNLRKYRKSYLNNQGKEEQISEKEIKNENILKEEDIVPFISEKKSEIPSENVESDGSFTKMKNYISEEPKTFLANKKIGVF